MYFCGIFSFIRTICIPLFIVNYILQLEADGVDNVREVAASQKFPINNETTALLAGWLCYNSIVYFLFSYMFLCSQPICFFCVGQKPFASQLAIPFLESII